MKMGDGINANTAYDANGNIKKMQQWGLKITSSIQLDDLKYTYIEGTNKLKSVTDFANTPQTSLGDFKTIAAHPQASTKAALTASSPESQFTAIEDYSYDANGNLVMDQNKRILSIEYNHLNLPKTIVLEAANPNPPSYATRSITYTYDAAGNKLKKVTSEAFGLGANKTVTTLYVAGILYESKVTNAGGSYNPAENYENVLQFIPQEEGRIRFKPAAGTTPASFQYDYMLKDHLGNVRTVLTEELQQDTYPTVTLENTTYNGGTAISLESQYYTIDNTKVVDKSTVSGITNYQNNNGNPPYNNNPYSNTTANSDKLFKLHGNDVNKTGLGITLKVMAGDRIDILGKSYYYQNATGVSTINPSDLVLQILSGFLGGPTGGAAGTSHSGVTAAQLNSMPATTGGISNLITQQNNNQPTDPPPPMAYINYIFFDEQFKYVSGGFSQVGGAGQLKDHYAELQNKLAQKNGYVYIYVSNTSATNVFFDNLQVVHTRGAILEETHYYPFGLTMLGISSEAAGSLQNKYKYNSKEKQSNEFSDGSGLEWLDYGNRMYDNQIGKWQTIDNLATASLNQSPYNYVINNPINFVDPDGRDVILFDRYNRKVATLGKNGVVFEKGMESSSDYVLYKMAKEYLAKGSSTTLSQLENNSLITEIYLTDGDIFGGGSFTTEPFSYGGKDLNGNKIIEPNEITIASRTSTVKNGVISWDPGMALVDAEGNVHSPALILEHEAKHALEALLNLIMYAKNKFSLTNDGTTNLEEKRVIGEVNKVSINLNNGDGGYGKRVKHVGGHKEYVFSPISIILIPQQAINGVKRNKEPKTDMPKKKIPLFF